MNSKAVPLWPFLVEIDEKARTLAADLPLLSVSQTKGVVRYTELFDKEPRAEDLGVYKLVEKNDIILNRMSADKGAVGLAQENGIVSPDYLVLRADHRVVPAFVVYLLKSDFGISEIRKILRGIGTGDTNTVRTPRVSRRELLHIKWPNFPDYAEQVRIVNQLDRELAEIDVAINELTKTGELSFERFNAKREQILSEHNGITVRLSRVLNGIKDGTHGSHIRVDEGGQVLLSAKNISSGNLVISDNESHITAEDAEQIISSGFPQKGDVLMILVGVTYGRSALYDLDETLPFQRSVGFLRPNPNLLSSKYLLQAIRSADFQNQLSLGIKTSAQPGIYLGDVSACHIKLPKPSDQIKICNAIEIENEKHKKAINEIEITTNIYREKINSVVNYFLK